MNAITMTISDLETEENGDQFQRLFISNKLLHHAQGNIAADMLSHLPERALCILRSSSFNGADLVRLESDVSRPSFRVGVGAKNHVVNIVLELTPSIKKNQGVQTNATIQLKWLKFSNPV